MLWLKADERLEKKEKLELKKSELTIERERVKAMYAILCDLRHIQLSKMYFKTDLAFRDFLTTLPSYEGDAKKDRESRRWKVTVLKPGEIPEWKKELMKKKVKN